MDVLYLLLLLLGAVCFAVAAVLGWGWRSTSGGPAPRHGGWSNIIALGLLFWILVPLIKQARGM